MARVGTIAAGNVVGAAIIKILPDASDFKIGNVLKNQFQSIDVQILKWSAALTGAAAAINPLVAGVASLSASFAVAGAGVAAFGILAVNQLKPVFAATSAVAKAQDQYNKAVAAGDPKKMAAALQAQRNALAMLDPQQRQATMNLVDMKQKFKDLSTSVRPQVFGSFNTVLAIATNILPQLGPLAANAGTAIEGLTSKLRAALMGPGFATGMKQFTAQTGTMISSLGQSIGNIGVTFGKVFQAALPIVGQVGGITKSLRDAASGPGLAQFFQSLVPAMREGIAALKSFGSAFNSLLSAAVPLAKPLMGVLKSLGDALNHLFKSADFKAFVDNLSGIVTAIKPLFSVLGDNIGKILKTMSGQILAVMPTLVQIVTTLANAFGQVVAGVSPLLPALLSVVDILVSFIPALYSVIQAFRTALIPVLQVVGTTLTGIKPMIMILATEFAALVTAIGPVIAQLLTGLLPVMNLLLQVVVGLLPVLTNFFENLGRHPAAMKILGTAVAGLATAFVALKVSAAISAMSPVRLIMTAVAAFAVLAVSVFGHSATVLIALGVALGVAGIAAGIFAVRIRLAAGLAATTIGPLQAVILVIGLVSAAFALFQDHTRNTKVDIDSMTEAIKNMVKTGDTALLKENILDQISKWKPSSSGLNGIEYLKKYGVQVGDLVEQLANPAGAAAFQQFEKNLDKQLGDMGDNTLSMIRNGDAVRGNTDAMKLLKDQMGSSNPLIAQMGTLFYNLEKDQSVSGKTVKGLLKSFDDLTSGMQKQVKAALDIKNTQSSLSTVWDKANAAQKALHDGIDGLNQAKSAEIDAWVAWKNAVDTSITTVRDSLPVFGDVGDAASTTTDSLNASIVKMTETAKTQAANLHKLTDPATLAGLKLPKEFLQDLIAQGPAAVTAFANASDPVRKTLVDNFGKYIDATNLLNKTKLDNGLNDTVNAAIATFAARKKAYTDAFNSVFLTPMQNTLNAMVGAMAAQPGEGGRQMIQHLIDQKDGVWQTTRATFSDPMKRAMDLAVGNLKTGGGLQITQTKLNMLGINTIADRTLLKKLGIDVVVTDKTGPPISAINDAMGKMALAGLALGIPLLPAGVASPGYNAGVGRAAGGPINGPGGPKDDMVPLWGSAGEHMVTADEVSAVGGHGAMFQLRKAMRAGAIKLARGGPVEADTLTFDDGPLLTKMRDVAVAAAAAAAAAGDAWSGGKLTWPVPGHFTISQHFGSHPGIDIPGAIGTSIVAANAGKVTDSGPASGFGNWIRILGQGLGTVYGHMPSNRLYQGVGDVVTAGQLIAGIGSEGYSTGPHLHFEVHPGGFGHGPVDPEPYLHGMVAASSGVTPGGSGVARWASMVNSVLAMEGLPQALAGRVLSQMQLESGGDPMAQNNWDSNAMKGQPSKGLLQTIQSTFDAYHWPGTSINIFDPKANIAAAVNYGRARYGAGTLGMGFGHGYEKGTAYVPHTGMAMLHQGEIVFPADMADKLRKQSGLAGGGPINWAAIAALQKNMLADVKALGYPDVKAAQKGLKFPTTGTFSTPFFNALQHAVQALFVSNVVKAQVAQAGKGSNTRPISVGGAAVAPSALTYTDAAGATVPINYNAANTASIAALRGKSAGATQTAAKLASQHTAAVTEFHHDQLGAFYSAVALAATVSKEKALYGVMLNDLRTHNTKALAIHTTQFKALEKQANQLRVNQYLYTMAANAQEKLATSTGRTTVEAARQAAVLKNQVAGAVAAAYAPAVGAIGTSVNAVAQTGSSITDLFSYQAGYGATSAAGAITALKAKIARTKQFVLNLTNLAKAGLDPALIAQLAAGGESASGSITAQLMADPGTIQQLNALEAQLAAIGTGGGAIVGNAAVARVTGSLVNAQGATAIDPGNLLGLGTAAGTAKSTIAGVNSNALASGSAGGATLVIQGGVTIRDSSDIDKIGQQLYIVAGNTQRAAGA